MDRAAPLLRYREGPDQLEAAALSLSDAELDYQPRDGGRSAREVVHHTADSELTSAIRLRKLLAEENAQTSGPYSVATWLEIYAAHCHDHAGQIARAVDEARRQSSAPAAG